MRRLTPVFNTSSPHLKNYSGVTSMLVQLEFAISVTHGTRFVMATDIRQIDILETRDGLKALLYIISFDVS